MTADSPSSEAVEQIQRFLLPKVGEAHNVRELYYVETRRTLDPVVFPDRFTVEIPSSAEVSFETYFNAFPASYWRRWSQLDRVILRVKVAGTARVDVYRSRHNGARIALDSAIVTDDAAEFSLSLDPFEDGGWLWFDVTAETDVTISEAGWFAPQAPGPQVLPDGTEVGPFDKRVTVGIPTFNRPADAVAALQALGEDEEVASIIDAVLMPDQGDKHPADEEGFKEAAEAFGDRFFEFRQGNLGGSGGYSRIMYEAMGGVNGQKKAGRARSPYILFMDDDIAIEPDSILRAVQTARFARTPFILGGQMLNLLQRSELRSMGEIVDRSSFMWAPAPYVHYDHDFSELPLGGEGRKASPENPQAKDLHRRIDVDFNGWWMCLFPRVVVEDLGQPLPLFIKWDDTEYSLRARGAGFHTVTWPGVAVWHMSWTDKDDSIDWQAYFHLRNRLIVAALHHDGPIKGLLRDLRKATVKHVLCMEYSTLAIRNEAMRDALAGPERLFEILESSLPHVNEIRSRYSDAKIIPSAAQLPDPSGDKGVPRQDVGGILKKLAYKPRWLFKGVLHNLTRADERHHEVPQANLKKDESHWFSLSQLDGATVTAASGKGVTYRKRDRDVAAALLKESVELERRIGREFDRLREEYRAALPELTSRSSWKQVFDA